MRPVVLLRPVLLLRPAVLLRPVVLLCPADAKVRARRVRYGGNRKDNFTEGWVEFKDKHVAKRAAALLNGHIIGARAESQTWCPLHARCA